ncbi:MAG TPA: hypothetical protein VF329_08940 [Gammaproteobacteria bacterium]
MRRGAESTARRRIGWALAAGLVAGIAVGGAVLYWNPITAAPAVAEGEFDRALHYALPAGAVVLTHGGGLPMTRRPDDVAELWESALRSVAAGTLVLSGEDGAPEAVGSRITVPSERTDLLFEGVILDDYWLVTVPGEGSLFVVEQSNVWPTMKDTLLPAVLGRGWPGPRSYTPTEGPGIGGTALVIGATGRFAAQEGSAVERYRLDRFTSAHGIEALAGELDLRLLDSAPAAPPPP